MTVKKTRRVNAKPVKATTQAAFAHWPEGHSAYRGVHGAVREAILVAAICVAGYARLNKTGISLTKKEGSAKVLARLVGPGPLSYHTRLKRFAGGKLTAEGAKWFAGRECEGEMIKGLVTAMQKGGEVEGLNFKHKFTV